MSKPVILGNFRPFQAISGHFWVIFVSFRDISAKTTLNSEISNSENGNSENPMPDDIPRTRTSSSRRSTISRLIRNDSLNKRRRSTSLTNIDEIQKLFKKQVIENSDLTGSKRRLSVYQTLSRASSSINLLRDSTSLDKKERSSPGTPSNTGRFASFSRRGSQIFKSFKKNIEKNVEKSAERSAEKSVRLDKFTAKYSAEIAQKYHSPEKPKSSVYSQHNLNSSNLYETRDSSQPFSHGPSTNHKNNTHINTTNHRPYQSKFYRNTRPVSHTGSEYSEEEELTENSENSKNTEDSDEFHPIEFNKMKKVVKTKKKRPNTEPILTDDTSTNQITTLRGEKPQKSVSMSSKKSSSIKIKLKSKSSSSEKKSERTLFSRSYDHSDDAIGSTSCRIVSPGGFDPPGFLVTSKSPATRSGLPGWFLRNF